MTIVLKDDFKYQNVGRNLDQPEATVEKTFAEKYLIINPKTSRVYQFWEILWLLLCILQFAMVPYT